MEIFKQTNFDFLGKKWPFIFFSLLLTAVGIVSLLLKGGPKYGIDFNGGALMDVNFKQRPTAEDIRAALRKKITGEIEVQEVANSQEVLISTSVRDPRGLEGVRNDMLSTLNATFNQGAAGKLDINTVTQSQLLEGLRDPLARAGAGLNDEQLQALVSRILTYRDTPPRSGLIRNLDELSTIQGVTPAVLNAIKGVAVAGNRFLDEIDQSRLALQGGQQAERFVGRNRLGRLLFCRLGFRRGRC